MSPTRSRLLAASLAVGLVVAAAAPAKTAHGTSGPDVLRDGSGTDRLYGRGGDDKLYGRQGDDLVVGGDDVLLEPRVEAPTPWTATFTVAETGLLVYSAGTSSREGPNASMLPPGDRTAPLVLVAHWDPEPPRR